MPRLSRSYRAALRPLLDRALTLEPMERAAYLADLRQESPTVVAHLEVLLEFERTGTPADIEAPGPMELRHLARVPRRLAQVGGARLALAAGVMLAVSFAVSRSLGH